MLKSAVMTNHIVKVAVIKERKATNIPVIKNVLL